MLSPQKKLILSADSHEDGSDSPTRRISSIELLFAPVYCFKHIGKKDQHCGRYDSCRNPGGGKEKMNKQKREKKT